MGRSGSSIIKWGRKGVLAEIRAMRREKADLSYVGACIENLPLVSAANYYFGGWGHAVRMAGINYDRFRRCQSWTRERILREIRRDRKRGLDLSYNISAARNIKLLAAAAFHFGGWASALARLGLDYETIRKQKRWTVDKIVREIRRLHRDRVDLSWKAMHRAGRSAVVSVACFHLGTWGKAINRAGLDYRKIKKKPGPKRHEWSG